MPEAGRAAAHAFDSLAFDGHLYTTHGGFVAPAHNGLPFRHRVHYVLENGDTGASLSDQLAWVEENAARLRARKEDWKKIRAQKSRRK